MSNATRRKIISRIAESLCAVAVLLALVPLALLFLRNIGIGSAERVRGPGPAKLTSR